MDSKKCRYNGEGANWEPEYLVFFITELSHKELLVLLDE